MTGDPTRDDTLRERLAWIVHDNVCGCRGGLGPCEAPDQDHYEAAAALLPPIRDHVAAAVQAERERVIAALDEIGPTYPDEVRRGLAIAALLLRKTSEATS